MIAKTGSALYRVNLIRDLRNNEMRRERKQRLAVILGAGCFGFFILSLLYSALTMIQMEHVLSQEKDKVERLRQEYQKYTAAKLIVDKSDIELLNDLQGKGIFWTKKLAAMAKHLPDNYWITRFAFTNNELKIEGYGYATTQQDQLLVLDGYLNRLRQDSVFSETFDRIQLNTVDRHMESNRIGFGFSAFTSKWRQP